MPTLLMASGRQSLASRVIDRFLFLLALVALVAPLHGATDATLLPGCKPLTLEGDLSAQMVAGIDRFLMREIERSVQERRKLWQRDFSSVEAYEKSVQPNRER